MRLFLMLMSAAMMFSVSARAQILPAGPDGEILSQPACFKVISQAPYTVMGNVLTNYYTADDGTQARHRMNFRLGPGEATEICAAGPFYEGRKLELVLRTIVPVFTCRTAITRDIVIYGRQKPEGGTESWASCHEQ